MEVVVAKMRTLGAAAYPLRHELADSTQAGQRLAALAILQTRPDFGMLDWVAARASSAERPFVQYHALLALLYAVRNGGEDQKDVLRRAYETAKAGIEGAHPDSDRRGLLDMIERELPSS
jgi:hypothetical protein